MVILSEEELSSSSSATPRCEERVISSFPSCSSSSPATPQWEYDVFLSFRGKDTCKNFTDHLYEALKQKGINPLKNDEGLERGKPISELFRVIEESRFAVIVLSKNYSDSTWCLDELAKIVECMEKRGMTVLPVFYHVDPSDVRHQTGTFAKAFAEETRKRKICSMEKEEMWRAALRKVGNLSGWHLGDWDESKIIHQIVEKIFQNLCDTFPRVTKGLAGIHFQVKHLISLLCVGLKDIRVIGIWGMGGIGKTTLAEVVYDQFSSQFEGCSFIENISKVSDLIKLQQRLLVDILKKEDICIKNVDNGVNLIKDGLGNKKILLVLDDVNHLDQLKYLANERNWFGSESRIIITTRDKQLLSAYKVDGLHECKILNNDDALQLFCLKAFEKEQPQEGYEEISQKFVDYANGLPLALDVLGSLLTCRGINHWKGAFKRLKQYPEANIFRSLKMSYDGLDNETEKNIFIYIACFLRERKVGLVTDILASLDLRPTIGMNVLIERSLITISNDLVQMHGLLQDMAWEILRKQCPAELGKRTGLRVFKDVLDVLENNEGTDALEIIDQDSFIGEVKNCTCSPEAFSKMTNLRFLKISNVLFPQGLEFLSNELRILQWRRYPLKSLPSSFKPKEIWELCMSYSQIEKLWDGDMFFPNLRSIDLSFSENLTQIPDLTGTPSLEILDLHDCINLENLPSKIEMKSLKTLILSGCSKVNRIPEFGENMKCFKELLLKGTAIEEIPPSIKHLTDIYNFMESTQCLPSSSSSSTRQWKYDVFLSFRGEDTCKGFTDHLCTALKDNGIITFKDDRELDMGDSVDLELFKAIEESILAIIVFSTNYAASTWCLDELVKILECKKNRGLRLVLPIFYNVNPFVVRYQTGTFGEAIAKHEIRFRENMEKVERWKAALTEVATISGEEVLARDESKLLHEIVDNILLKLHDKTKGDPLLTTKLVGKEFQKHLDEISKSLMKDDVLSIGIHGMGGVGKTTLLKHIHNQLLENSFNVCWVTVSQDFSIKKLQTEIYKVLSPDPLNEDDVNKRVAKLDRTLRGKEKSIIILDDVWKSFSLQDVGIHVEVNGCKLILTTRFFDVCQRMKCSKYLEVLPLNEEEAWKLFMEKFGHGVELSPEVSYIARSIAKECAGLPLGIITMASSMRGKDFDIREWRNALEELKQSKAGLDDTEDKLFQVLKFSYSSLKDAKLQECFLYCSLYPEDFKIEKDELIKHLIDEGIIEQQRRRHVEFDKGHSMLNTLENAYLLEGVEDDEENKCVKMHDLLRDMAIQIARDSHNRFMVEAGKGLEDLPDEEEWKDDFEKVSLMSNNFSEIPSNASPRCPKLLTLMLNDNVFLKRIEYSFFARMTGLKVLNLSNTDIKDLPNSISDLENLTALLLRECERLEHVPSLAKLTALRRLDLRFTGIREIPQGLEMLVNLRYLDLCCHLKIFPIKILPELSHLQYLVFNSYSDAVKVKGNEVARLKRLETFEGTFYDIRDFNIYVRSLKEEGGPIDYILKVGEVSYEEVLIFDLSKEKNVILAECGISKSRGGEDSLVLPNDVQCLVLVDISDLRSLCDVPCFKNLANLKKLGVQRCKEIDHILRSYCTLPLLQSVEVLILRGLDNLRVLIWEEGVASSLVPLDTFSRLKEFFLDGCHNIKKLFTPELLLHLHNLEKIYVGWCHQLVEIIAASSNEVEEEDERNKEEGMDTTKFSLPRLRVLKLDRLQNLKSICASSKVMACDSIQEISIPGCPKLKRFPLFLPLLNGQLCAPPSLKKIAVDTECWESLEWDHPNSKTVLQPLRGRLFP